MLSIVMKQRSNRLPRSFVPVCFNDHRHEIVRKNKDYQVQDMLNDSIAKALVRVSVCLSSP